MKIAIFVLASTLTLGATTGFSAQIDVGELEHHVELTNISPFTSLAIGQGAEAHNTTNKVAGNVKGNKFTQTFKADKSPVTSLAIGSGAKATNTFNTVEGKE